MPKIEMPFKTAYSGHERVVAPTGSRYQNEYGYEIDKYGRKVLVKTGETDLYAKIQESLEETKIENVIARCIAGDTSVLRPDGIYADLTQQPSNLLEAQQMIQQLENVWNGLSKEIKEKYNWDVSQFIAASDTEEWARDMGLLKEKESTPSPIKETPKKEEVTADE